MTKHAPQDLPGVTIEGGYVVICLHDTLDADVVLAPYVAAQLAQRLNRAAREANAEV